MYTIPNHQSPIATMHIALLIYGSLETLSGGYLYDRQLVTYLRGQGDRVEIISLPWRNYARHLGDNANGDLLRQLAALPVDLLLQDELNHPSLFWLNQSLRRMVNYPIVSVIHHLRADEDHPRSLRPFYRWVERRYLQSVDAAIYNSHSTRRAVTKLLGRTLPGVVALPAGEHLKPPSSEQIEAILAQRQSEISPLRLISVGTVIPRKGIHHLLPALALLGGDWQLEVVGALEVAPAYVADLRRSIAKLNLGDRVHLRGRLTDDEVAAALKASHALILLSYEGFGIAFLEAMSFGLPVIAANVGAAPEVIDDGITGFLVDPLDARAVAARIEQARDPAVRSQMGWAARRRFDHHPTWAESGRRSRDFLLSLIGD
ncbi:MAG: glycosyltransferase family 4 protein [Caldilineaceae bacterium]|nr:glycosyltransferase family 4 protein [Caldilineaceae bacterium]